MSINKSHGKNKDKYLDKNGANEVSAADIRILLNSDVSLRNKDTILDEGGPNEISAEEIKIAIATRTGFFRL